MSDQSDPIAGEPTRASPGAEGAEERPTRVLLAVAEPIDAERLRDALDAEDLASTELLVVAPALNDSALAYWVSDPDEAIAQAEAVATRTASSLEASEATVRDAEVGESDAEVAVEDALRRFPAERIVVFRHPAEQSAYRETLRREELEERFGIPVTERLVAR